MDLNTSGKHFDDHYILVQHQMIPKGRT